MYCENCGKENVNGAEHCIYCGEPVGNKRNNSMKSNEKETSEKESKILKTILSILLSIAIFVVGFFCITIVTVRESLSDDVIEDVCGDIDAEMIAKDSSFGKLVQKLALQRINTNEKNLERFLEKSTFFEAVENIADEYADYLLKGKKPDGISNADFVNFVRENGDVIRQELEYEDVAFDYHKYYDIDNEEAFGILSEDADISEGLEIVKNVISRTTVWIVIVVATLLAIILLNVRKRKIDSTFMWLGVTICFVALMFGISWIVGNLLVDFINDDLTKEIISVYTHNSSGVVIKNVVFTAIFGAMCIVIKSLLKKKGH